MDLIIKEYAPENETEVVELWQSNGLVTQANNPHKDIARKLLVDPDLFLVGWQDSELVATVMGGYEGHRGWINYLAVADSSQKKGLGLAMMQAIEQRLLEKGCPKINLQIRSSNKGVIDFYRQLEYVEDKVVSMGKRLVLD